MPLLSRFQKAADHLKRFRGGAHKLRTNFELSGLDFVDAQYDGQEVQLQIERSQRVHMSDVAKVIGCTATWDQTMSIDWTLYEDKHGQKQGKR
jgi:hypothetical protein